MPHYLTSIPRLGMALADRSHTGTFEPGIIRDTQGVVKCHNLNVVVLLAKESRKVCKCIG